MDWKFWIGDVGIPIVTFIIGLFAGKAIEKHWKTNAKIKGNSNTVIQNSNVEKQ